MISYFTVKEVFFPFDHKTPYLSPRLTDGSGVTGHRGLSMLRPGGGMNYYRFLTRNRKFDPTEKVPRENVAAAFCRYEYWRGTFSVVSDGSFNGLYACPDAVCGATLVVGVGAAVVCWGSFFSLRIRSRSKSKKIPVSSI